MGHIGQERYIMYKTATNNLNYAYDFSAIYKLTLPSGKTKEKIVSRRVTSAWMLSNKEVVLLGDIWRDETIESFGKQLNNPEVNLDFFEVEWSMVDRNGNPFGHKENQGE